MDHMPTCAEEAPSSQQHDSDSDGWITRVSVASVQTSEFTSIECEMNGSKATWDHVMVAPDVGDCCPHGQSAAFQLLSHLSQKSVLTSSLGNL